jgi:hypothetical protein
MIPMTLGKYEEEIIELNKKGKTNNEILDYINKKYNKKFSKISHIRCILSNNKLKSVKEKTMEVYEDSILRLHKEGLTNKQIGEILTYKHKTLITQEQVKHFIGYRGLKCNKTERNGFDIIKPQDIPSDVTDADMWNKMKDESEKYMKKFKSSNKATIEFKENKFVAIPVFSDQHLGHEGVDYEKMEDDAKLVANTPNVYPIMTGDAIDNFIKANILSAMINATTSPKQQIKLFRHYLTLMTPKNGTIADKLLAYVSGNHDRRTKEVSGLDWMGPIVKANKFLYNPSEFYLTVKFPSGISYVIGMRHQYRFNSTLNYTHTVKQWLKNGSADFDIGVIGHNHNPASENFTYQGTMRLAIRPGTYKTCCTWSRDKGYMDVFEVIMPTIILNPFVKKMDVMNDIESAVSVINSLNRGRK